MNTLHRKITHAFAVQAGLMALLAIFAILDLLYLEQRIEQDMVVTHLEDLVQEMRREEKNLFLYRARQAREAADRQAEKILQLLHENPQAFVVDSSVAQLGLLRSALQNYRKLLADYRVDDTAVASNEARIREQGRIASQIGGAVFSSERESAKTAIKRAKWAQVVSVIILAVLLLAMGRLLARSVVSPLKRLVADLIPIAEGRFDRLEMRSHNAELATLREAFNRMLDELEARRRRLIQSEKLAALGVLMSGVAHELNNPLSNISSSSQLLLEELDSADREQLAEWAQTIDSETERAKKIVAALLDFGRRREPHLTPTPLLALLARTLLLLRGQLRKTGVHIEQHTPEELVLAADPQRLQQVFINLIRNAAESGENLTIRISAKACKTPVEAFPSEATVIGEPGCYLRPLRRLAEIVIEDNGPGIPTDILPRVFEPFYTTRAPGRGMGLGLYIVQEIVQEHDGCIAVTSQPGVGTRIVLRLPCKGNKK